jgi:putative membrane protein
MEKRMSQFVKVWFLAAGLVLGANAATYAAEEKAVSDNDFLIKAVTGGVAEVQFSQLAKKHATDAKVKAFATRMVDDHSKANKKLLEYAKGLKVGVVTGLNKDRRAAYSNLSKLSNGDFDREYMKTMVEDHEKALSLYQSFAKHGSHDGLRTFASDTLPTLKAHLKEAREIYARLKR